MADRENNILDLDNRISDLEKRMDSINLEEITWNDNPNDLIQICKTIRQSIEDDFNRVISMIDRFEGHGYSTKQKRIYTSFPTLRTVQKEKRKRRNAKIDKIERAIKLFKQNNGKKISLGYKKVTWKILPPGKWSISDIKNYYFEFAKRFPSENIDLSRLEIIERLNPFECLLGENENYGYVAYRFKRV